MLEEAYRLLEMQSDDFEIHKLNEDQKFAINQARKQIENGNFLTYEEATTDKWLNK